MDFQKYWQTTQDWLTGTGLTILIIIVVALVMLRLARLVVNRLIDLFSRDSDEPGYGKRLETLRSVVNSAVSVAIMGVALMIILDKLGVNIGPVLATAGIVGLAIGFGAQQLVQDVISGFFILIEDQIRVGDVIQIAGKSGLVEKVSLRTTQLRDLAGSVHFVRNGHIDTVTNMTQEYSFAVFEIGVAYKENIDQVIEVIKQTGQQLRSVEAVAADILDDIEVLGVDKLADSAVMIKARIKTQPIRQWAVMREFNRLLKMTFDENEIEIPFPHMTIFMGADKAGQTQPLRTVTVDS